MACGGTQVGDARDLVPVRQATAGTDDHNSGFSHVRAPPCATERADLRVAVRAEDPSHPVDGDIAAAVDDANVSSGPATATPALGDRCGPPLGLQASGRRPDATDTSTNRGTAMHTPRRNVSRVLTDSTSR